MSTEMRVMEGAPLTETQVALWVSRCQHILNINNVKTITVHNCDRPGIDQALILIEDAEGRYSMVVFEGAVT